MSTLTTPNTLTAGDDIDAAPLNENFTEVETIVNGNLDNTNMTAGADIAVTKLDDYSANQVQMQTTSDPGEVETESLATDISGELARLRYALDEARGTAQWYASNAADAASVIKNLADLPTGIGPNLLINGSFDIGTAADTSAFGWTNVDTATLALEATDVAQGQGLALQITAAGSATEGVSQTLAGLKASTTYVFVGYVKPANAGSSGTIATTGGDTDLSLTWDGGSDSTTVYTAKTGTFTTNTTPSDIVLSVLTDADTDIGDFDNFSVRELQLVNRTTGPGRIVEQQESTAPGTGLTGASFAAWEMDGAATAASIDVQVPGPGYYIKVSGVFSGHVGASAYGAVRLKEGATVKAASYCTTPGAAANMSGVLEWKNTNPTPGTVYTYTVEGIINTGTWTPQGTTGQLDSQPGVSVFCVEVIPYG